MCEDRTIPVGLTGHCNTVLVRKSFEQIGAPTLLQLPNCGKLSKVDSLIPTTPDHASTIGLLGAVW